VQGQATLEHILPPKIFGPSNLAQKEQRRRAELRVALGVWGSGSIHAKMYGSGFHAMSSPGLQVPLGIRVRSSSQDGLAGSPQLGDDFRDGNLVPDQHGIGTPGSDK